MGPQPMIIAIDGPAGSGKSSTAKEVARRLGFVHLDTGAMYRAVTLACLRDGVGYDDDAALSAVMARTKINFTGTPPDTRTWLDGQDVTDAIRGDDVTRAVSDYCKPTVVRTALVALQREIAALSSVVTEGRDVTTVVFPKADLKFYMSASVEERARRRQRDFAAMGVGKDIEDLIRELQDRDRKDSTRANSPLRKADDAEEIDTTRMSLPEQAAYILNRVRERTERRS